MDALKPVFLAVCLLVAHAFWAGAAESVGANKEQNTRGRKEAVAKQGDIELRVSLSEKVFSGHAMLLDIALANTSKKMVIYQYRLANPLKYKVTMSQPGRPSFPVPLTGAGASEHARMWEGHRDPPSRGSLFKGYIAPGGGLLRSINLSRFFDLSVSGRYRVQVFWTTDEWSLSTPELEFEVEMPTRYPLTVEEAYKWERIKPDLAAVEALLADPKEDPVVRNLAIEELQRWGRPGLSDKLIEVLNDEKGDEYVRAECAKALGVCLKQAEDAEKNPILKALRSRLRDERETVRIKVIEALGESGDEASRAAFEEALRSDSERVRKAAEQALGLLLAKKLRGK